MIEHCAQFVGAVNERLQKPITKEEYIGRMADKQPIAYISSVDIDGFPWTKAILKPRKREGIKTFYFTTNTFSIRVAQYKANPSVFVHGHKNAYLVRCTVRRDIIETLEEDLFLKDRSKGEIRLGSIRLRPGSFTVFLSHGKQSCF